jgi:hypothetical protein
LALASTDHVRNTSAGGRLFDHLATQAIQKALNLYHHGLVLAPLAMRMVMNVLRIGWNFAGTTLRRLVQILRTVIQQP